MVYYKSFMGRQAMRGGDGGDRGGREEGEAKPLPPYERFKTRYKKSK